MSDPSFIARLYEYGLALAQYWWLLVTGGVLVIEPLIETALPTSAKEFLDRYWPPENRHHHFRWASVFALMIASFLAFDDVSSRNRSLQANLQTVLGERDEARRQARDAGNPVPPSPRQNSRLYWGSLTRDETLALRAELRNVSRAGLLPTRTGGGRLNLTIAQVGILCNDGFCSDLAGSLVEAFHGVGVTADMSAALGSNLDGLRIRPDNQTTHDIATAIEKVTNGRLLISIGPGNHVDEGVVISIGRKTD